MVSRQNDGDVSRPPISEGMLDEGDGETVLMGSAMSVYSQNGRYISSQISLIDIGCITKAVLVDITPAARIDHAAQYRIIFRITY